MRRIALVVLLALTSPALMAAAPAEPAAFTAEQKADLRRVSDYLNGMRSLTGHFLQIGPDGTPQEGTFYLKKPGRLRFEYNKPSPVLVIADGSTIAVTNSKLRTTDRYPLLNSPLRVLLSDDVDLSSDSRIGGITREPGAMSVIARQASGPAQGQITLTFADSGSALELRQWEVLDAQGMRTIVVVNDLKLGVDLPARLFVIEDLSPFSHREN
jgi:outer membrane lipoprotein-sorting protein